MVLLGKMTKDLAINGCATVAQSFALTDWRIMSDARGRAGHQVRVIFVWSVLSDA